MAVFRNGGVACRSTITFHSGSLRDGIHYTVARETDGNRGEEKTHMEIGRHEQRGEKKKRKFHLAVKVIMEETYMHQSESEVGALCFPLFFFPSGSF